MFIGGSSSSPAGAITWISGAAGSVHWRFNMGIPIYYYLLGRKLFGSAIKYPIFRLGHFPEFLTAQALPRFQQRPGAALPRAGTPARARASPPGGASARLAGNFRGRDFDTVLNGAGFCKRFLGEFVDIRFRGMSKSERG